MKNITVIKIGGSTFGSGDTTVEDIVALQKKGHALVVIHGGGSAVTDWLKRQGAATRFVRGERVTDLPTLQVATAVLSGLINKEITAAINLRGGRACGISGVDGALIESAVKDPEMGFVGSVVKVNAALLETLLKGGFVPIISPRRACIHRIDWQMRLRSLMSTATPWPGTSRWRLKQNGSFS